jgi:hypothetical protein
MTPALPLSAQRAAFYAGLALLLSVNACKGKGGRDALAKAVAADERFAHVPVPPTDGPRLTVVLPHTPVFERPSVASTKLGELEVGASLARSRDPYTKADCDGGWFAVRPRGFVCAGPNASVDPTILTKGLPGPPDLTHALPYRYARAKTEGVPVYSRVPSAEGQLASEPDLKKVLGKGEDQEALGSAANDVPLDEHGVATGPPVLLAGGEGVDSGQRTRASYFVFGANAPPPLFAASDIPLRVGLLRKGSGVAMTGSLVENGRRFAVTAEGRLVPTDRLKPALGTTWHGIDLEKAGLPIAFVHKHDVHTYALLRGKAVKHDDELDYRSAVLLSNKFRTVEGVRFEETRDGAWIRSVDLMGIVKRHKFPDFVKGPQKWIDVSIANQTLTAYEGTKPVYATLVSTGRDQLKDPTQSASTARGTFRITDKYVTREVDPREVLGAFDVADAPWVMEFSPGFALTGAYWYDLAGEAYSFHNIALAPIDAHWLYLWADPQVPEGWHAAHSAPDEGTFVFVRP